MMTDNTPAPASMIPAESPPSRRIGGWLWLPAIGLSLSPVRFAMSIDGALKAKSSASWEILTTPSSPNYIPLMKPAFAFDVISGILLGLCNLWILWLFFTKSKRLPPMVIGWFAAIFICAMIDALLGRAMSLPPKALDELTMNWMRAAAICVI